MKKLSSFFSTNESFYAKSHEVWKRRKDGAPKLVGQHSCPGGQCLLGGPMAANAADRVKGAVDGVVAKIEKATDSVVTNLENITNETVNKLGRVEDKFGGMFKGVNASLDELIGGHNGGPPLDK